MMRDYTILIPVATLLLILFGIIHGIRYAYLVTQAKKRAAAQPSAQADVPPGYGHHG